MILQEKQILELLKKPKNALLIEEAKEKQLELKHFFNDSKKELIFDKVSEILTPDKLGTFKKVYKNHAQTIISQIVIHYKKIYEAHGRVFAFSFGENVTAEADFHILREKIYNGAEDTKYWEDYAHPLIFTEPGSVFLTGQDSSPQIKRIKLDNIWDIEANESGIQYLIVVEKINQGKEGEYKRFYIYDELNFYIYRQTREGFVKETFYDEENEIVVREGLHGASQCPAHFLYDVNETSDNFIVKKSPISDSLKDFYTYTILRTFYENYKYFSAFGVTVEAETRCGYRDSVKKLVCEDGWLQSFDPDHKVRPVACPECNKNKNVAGRIIKIPLNQQANESFLGNIDKLYRRIDADKGILEFHADDVERIKTEILNDCLGLGYDSAQKKEAFNVEQVQSDFDKQESNLAHFSKKVEQAWTGSLTRAAEMFSDSFDNLSIFLGRNYFLKSIEQLYKELELLYKGTSNVATIQKKQYEIFLTENKHNEAFLDRYNIIKVLQPFSDKPQSYINTNRALLQKTQPRMIRMYDNFGQVLNMFEFMFGRIETFGVNQDPTQNMNAKNLRISNLISKFNEILNQNILTQYGESIEISQ